MPNWCPWHDCLYLPDLVEAATAEGFRPLCIQTATRGEWEEFESRLVAGPRNGC
jgi:hypothetical protein